MNKITKNKKGKNRKNGFFVHSGLEQDIRILMSYDFDVSNEIHTCFDIYNKHESKHNLNNLLHCFQIGCHAVDSLSKEILDFFGEFY